ncbi:unannotated protein [freshwater metagenome]|uniref:Unannotated protein n=1 Tax=freshwater metagenome TaxID=449393 RepID=A0A6J7H549_9ZZZZ
MLVSASQITPDDLGNGVENNGSRLVVGSRDGPTSETPTKLIPQVRVPAKAPLREQWEERVAERRGSRMLGGPDTKPALCALPGKSRWRFGFGELYDRSSAN